jgi:hypothetical protein
MQPVKSNTLRKSAKVDRLGFILKFTKNASIAFYLQEKKDSFHIVLWNSISQKSLLEEGINQLIM